MQVAGALGVAVLGTISTDRTRSLLAAHRPMPDALTSGYHLAFLVGAAWVACAIVAAAVVVRPRRGAARAGAVAGARLEPSAKSPRN